jgi:hypothetical protein
MGIARPKNAPLWDCRFHGRPCSHPFFHPPGPSWHEAGMYGSCTFLWFSPLPNEMEAMLHILTPFSFSSWVREARGLASAWPPFRTMGKPPRPHMGVLPWPIRLLCWRAQGDEGGCGWWAVSRGRRRGLVALLGDKRRFFVLLAGLPPPSSPPSAHGPCALPGPLLHPCSHAL